MPIVNVTDISKDHVADAIARMEMDIKTVATAHRGLSSGYMKLLRELQSLDAENAALRADRERLDWLTDALDWVELGDCVPTDHDAEGRSRLDAWRLAIDAARKEKE